MVLLGLSAGHLCASARCAGCIGTAGAQARVVKRTRSVRISSPPGAALSHGAKAPGMAANTPCGAPTQQPLALLCAFPKLLKAKREAARLPLQLKCHSSSSLLGMIRAELAKDGVPAHACRYFSCKNTIRWQLAVPPLPLQPQCATCATCAPRGEGDAPCSTAPFQPQPLQPSCSVRGILCYEGPVLQRVTD